MCLGWGFVLYPVGKITALQTTICIKEFSKGTKVMGKEAIETRKG